MSRQPRAAEGGLIYHTSNRGNVGLEIFSSDHEYAAFEQVLSEAVARERMRLLAYCLMPDHFQLVLWPRGDGDLSRFMRWLTFTHAHRWHAHRGTAGTGHLYQGRFKSFPVQSGEHLLAVCRYVERSPLRGGLVSRAQDWRWSSLSARRAKGEEGRPALSAWPVERPPDWTTRINRPSGAADEEDVQRSIRRGQPYGSPSWQAQTAARLGLESTFRNRGRPRKVRPAEDATPPAPAKAAKRKASPPAPAKAPRSKASPPAPAKAPKGKKRSGTSR
jgi:putative transposase